MEEISIQYQLCDFNQNFFCYNMYIIYKFAWNLIAKKSKPHHLLSHLLQRKREP